MTVVGLASLVNTLAIVVVLGISAKVAAHYEAPFFRLWTRGYVGLVVMLALESINTMFVRRLGFDLAELTVYATSSISFLEAGTALSEKTPNPFWRNLALAFFVLLGVGLRLAGVPFGMAILPGVLTVSVGYIRLGLVFLQKAQFRGSSTLWIAGPLLILGAWPLTYPLVEGSPYGWLGYLFASLLHLSVGFGMIVYVLERHTATLQKQHQELEQLQDDFLATISHELRTPVTAIKAGAGALQAGLLGPLSSEQADYVDIISRNSNRLHGLINELLNFAEAQAQAMTFSEDETDVVKVVADAVRSIAPFAAEREVKLLFESGPPLLTYTDQARFAQVVLNLLSNAVKFSPNGGEIRLTLSRRGDNICLEVRDNGPGISEEDQTRLFSKFFRTGRANTRQSGGTGLGLALAKKIVEDGLKGAIWVESKLEEGSTFFVTIPVLQAKPDITAGGK